MLRRIIFVGCGVLIGLHFQGCNADTTSFSKPESSKCDPVVASACRKSIVESDPKTAQRYAWFVACRDQSHRTRIYALCDTYCKSETQKVECLIDSIEKRTWFANIKGEMGDGIEDDDLDSGPPGTSSMDAEALESNAVENMVEVHLDKSAADMVKEGEKADKDKKKPEGLVETGQRGAAYRRVKSTRDNSIVRDHHQRLTEDEPPHPGSPGKRRAEAQPAGRPDAHRAASAGGGKQPIKVTTSSKIVPASKTAPSSKGGAQPRPAKGGSVKSKDADVAPVQYKNKYSQLEESGEEEVRRVAQDVAIYSSADQSAEDGDSHQAEEEEEHAAYPYMFHDKQSEDERPTGMAEEDGDHAAEEEYHGHHAHEDESYAKAGHRGSDSFLETNSTSSEPRPPSVHVVLHSVLK